MSTLTLPNEDGDVSGSNDSMGILDSLPPVHAASRHSLNGKMGGSSQAPRRQQQLMISTTAANIRNGEADNPLAQVDLREQKIEGLKWLQAAAGLRLFSDMATNAQILATDVYENFYSGVVLCKALNVMMQSNPEFVEQNLPVIDVLEQNADTDPLVQSTNLANFVRTCQLYFNVDAHELLNPVEVVKMRSLASTKSAEDLERPFIKTLYFLKLVAEETGLNAVPVVVQGKPFVTITYEQLTELIELVMRKSDGPGAAAPVVPRVLMNIRDTEEFKEIQSRFSNMNQEVQAHAQQLKGVESRLAALEKAPTVNQGSSVQYHDNYSDKITQLEKQMKEIELRISSSTGKPVNLVTSPSSMLQPITTGLMPPIKPRRRSSTANEAENREAVSELPVRMPTSPKPSMSAVSRRVSTDSAGTNSSNTSAPLSPVMSPAAKVFRLPNEVLQQNLPKEEVLRQSAIYEIIDSEADYVRDLNVLIEMHLKNIRSKRMLDEKSLKTLFSNVEELLPVNQQLLAQLITRRDQSPRIDTIGDIFCTIADRLSVYHQYCSNYPFATHLYKQMKAVNPMKDYIDTTMNQADYRGLSLESYLIKPVQRVCKYPLLLRELVRHTAPANLDRELVQKALDQIQLVVNAINEKTTNASEKEKTMDLLSKIESNPPLTLDFAANRTLIREGSAQKLINGRLKERYIVLFNDTLLICKMQVLKQYKYQMELSLDLPNTVLNIGGGTKNGAFKMGKNQIELINSTIATEEPLILNFVNDVDRAKWITLFEQCFKTIGGTDAENYVASHVISCAESDAAPSATNSTNSLSRALSGLPIGNTSSVKKSNTLSMRMRTTGLFGKKRSNSQENLPESRLHNDDANTTTGTEELNLTEYSNNCEVLVEAEKEYSANAPSFLSFPRGAFMRVVNKQRQDYWKVQNKNACGWIPASHVRVREVADIGSEKWLDTIRQCRVNGSEQVCEYKSLPATTVAEVPYFPEEEYPDWHVVDAGNGAFYFFNSETNETSWYPPHITDAAIENARNTRPKEVTQRLIEERLEYSHRLQHQLTAAPQ